ncbi:hypothetical protein B9479_004978 [Cryptococcus floricola]|uniref:Uncharacterized protein n=1 Tax=Cryptococcus floricola TaxID=2591691 RepID=A0A5D3AWB4_9TREE|nr:hypothetical protein B9479_004978 [Cryptococcus floricola]
MPTSPPPLSPTPRRWRANTGSPHPDIASLLNTYEQGGNSATITLPPLPPSESSYTQSSGSSNWATPKTSATRRTLEQRGDEEDEAEVEYMTTSDSLERDTPDIRTTSPSPQRPLESYRSDATLSPLLAPSRGRLFGEDASSTLGKAHARAIPREQTSSNNSGTVTPTNPIPPQVTGQSTATIDAAYDGVFSQLDALAGAETNSPPRPTHTRGASDPGSNVWQPTPLRQPLVGLGLSFPEERQYGVSEFSRLSTVSERTERSAMTGMSHQLSPTVPGAFHIRSHSDASAARYPLPPSPSRPPRTTGTPGAGAPVTPKKTSDLIKMFESKSTPGKGDVPAVPQPTFAPSRAPPSPSSRPPPTPIKSDPLFSPPTLPNPPPIPTSSRPTTAPTPPPKIGSPLSSVRTMIASWRSKSSSGSGSGSGGKRQANLRESSPGLSRGGDKGWNVSIRRRKRHEKELAEREAQDEAEQAEKDRKEAEFMLSEEEEKEVPGEEEQVPSRTSSLRSSKRSASEPKQLTGDLIRSGPLYYLNVHDEDKDEFEWVRADGRMYNDGIELSWATSKRGTANVTLDLENCDEVASTYSPNNPMAKKDLGAAAARRQGKLADNLYPFKLASRLCSIARDRVRWVNAIWTVLEHTRAPTLDRDMSLRANRSSSDHASDTGSSSTHFATDKPYPSPHSSASHNLYTADDAVIETSGGLHAPIVQQGSRKLAAPGLERVRSLRRVASEADLRDSASEISMPVTTTTHDLPLTAANAQRPTARDFTFARGIKPPSMASEGEVASTWNTPMQGGATLTPASGFHSLEGSSRRSAPSESVVSPHTPASTFPRAPPSESAFTTASTFREAPPSDHTVRAPSSTHGGTMYTARPPSMAASTPAYTAAQLPHSEKSTARLPPGMPPMPSTATTSTGHGSSTLYTSAMLSTPASSRSAPSMKTARPGKDTPRVAEQILEEPVSETLSPAATFAELSPSLTPAFTARQLATPTTVLAPGLSDVGTEGLTTSSHTARPGTYADTAPPASMNRTADAPSTPGATGTWREPSDMQNPQAASSRVDLPRVAVTGASPSERSVGTARLAASERPTWTAEPGTPYRNGQALSTAGLSAQYTTAPVATDFQSVENLPRASSTYTAAVAGTASPLQTPKTLVERPSSRSSKSSDVSYQSAPPPVPSRDSQYFTVSMGPSSKASTGKAPSIPADTPRYQLYDAPAPSFSNRHSGAYEYAAQGDDQTFVTGLQPAPSHRDTFYVTDNRSSFVTPTATYQYTDARSEARSSASLETAPTSSGKSPRSSQWQTAPPPPISHDAQSIGTNTSDAYRRESRAWTQVSHPDSDDEMLAELERRSSNGSAASRNKTLSIPVPPTAFSAAKEHSAYNTMRESVYAPPASWESPRFHSGLSQATLFSTAPGITSYYTTNDPMATPQPPQASISTASSVASPKKIARVPPPPVEVVQPPPPSPTSHTAHSSSTSSYTTTDSSRTARAQENTDVLRLLNFLQGQELAKSGQTTRMGNQLDRIERGVTKIAENQSVMARDLAPPPVPSKSADDETTPPSSPASSTSSVETARPVTPPPLLLPEVVNSQFDDLRNLLGTLIGRQEDILGRQELMAQEIARGRNLAVEFPERAPGLMRLEDLLKRVLNKVGDSEFTDEYMSIQDEKMSAYARSNLSTPKTMGTKDGSLYDGSSSVYSGEFAGHGRRAPANSVTSEQERRNRPLSGISDSLLEGHLGSPDFDEDFALSGLPPDTPPQEFVARQLHGPPTFLHRNLRQAPHMATPLQQPRAQQTPQHAPMQEYQEPQYYQDEESEQEPEEPMTEYEPSEAPLEREATPVPIPKDISPQESPVQPPVPYRTEDDYQDDQRPFEDDQYDRNPTRQLPAPQKLDLPTPVNSPRNMPPQFSQPGPSMRPPFPPGPGMFPPGPGMSEMSRPSLPRIAGVRDPISTTYFRRGFPPGPMGMGMFPGPMGIPGPGMGPHMPGLRPGLNGYGGPLGPNVNPSLRRPGFFPPGVTSTTGDYGLPAAAYQGLNNVPGGPDAPQGLAPPMSRTHLSNTSDTGLGNTTTESTVSTVSTPSVLTEEIVTPATAHTHMAEPVHVSVTTTAPPTQAAPTTLGASTMALPSTPGSMTDGMTASENEMIMTDSGSGGILDTAMALAQGDQQNEMSRYLHGMSDQIADGTHATQNQLGNILNDIAALREQLKPKHVAARVLSDGTVTLDNGDIIDGIRGVPAPVIPGAPSLPPPPATATHVEGRILPDGTVMVGGRIVDGIKGAPSAPSPSLAAVTALEEEIIEEENKNLEQDKKLAELQEKIEELIKSSAPQTETRIFEEEEVISMRNNGSPAVAPTEYAATTPGAASTVLGPSASVAPEGSYIPTAYGPSVHPTVAGAPLYNPSKSSQDRTVIREREIVREGPHGKQKEVVFEEDLAGTVAPGDTIHGSVSGSLPAAGTVAHTLPPGTVVAEGTLPPGSVYPSAPGTMAPGTVVAEGTLPPGSVYPSAPGTMAPGTIAGSVHPGTTMPPGSVYPGTVAPGTAMAPGTVAGSVYPGTAAPTVMGDPSVVGSPTPTRINPRTGRPLTIPTALSQHTMSPIQSEFQGPPTHPQQLIREEHEEIIHRPNEGGPPVTTHNTSRTYTQLPPGTQPAGSGGVVPGSVAGTALPTGAPLPSAHPSAPATVFADPAGHPSGPTHTIPPMSVHPPSSDAGVAFAPDIVPGAHYSDHQSVVAQPPPNIPAEYSAHESATMAPGPVPIDTQNASIHHTQHRGSYAAHPTAAPTQLGDAPAHAPTTAANIPSRAATTAPSVAAPSVAGGFADPNIPSSHAPSNVPSHHAGPELWDTNHAKPVSDKPTELSNVPTGQVADPANAPHGAAATHPPSAMADPSVAASSDSAKKNGVHWGDRMPIKDVPLVPGRSPKPSASSLPPATELSNVPSESVSDPTDKALPADPAIAASQHGDDANTATPAAPAHTGEPHTKTPLSGILRKPVPESEHGVSNVPADTASHPDHSTVGHPVPTHAGDKDTRVSDTAHVAGPPTMAELQSEGRDLTAYPGGQTVHVPPRPASAASHNKLQKRFPAPGQGSMHDPRELAGNAPVGSHTTPSHGDHISAKDPSEASHAAGTHRSADIPILEKVTLPDGTEAYVRSNPATTLGPSRPGTALAPSRPGSAMAHTYPASSHPHDDHDTSHADHHEVAPLGTRPPSALTASTGHLRSTPPGVGSDRDAPIGTMADAPKSEAGGAHSHGPSESDLGRGHCSVCCPHGARLENKIPIEACEHQNGALGDAIPGMTSKPGTPSGPRSHRSIAPTIRALSAQSAHTPASEHPHHHDEVDPFDMHDGTAREPSVGGGLSKGRKTPTLSLEEEALEDARRLAVKQKAAAEQAASEKSERDLKMAEKEEKRRLADERHEQNMEALTNLQKMLDLLSSDHASSKSSEGDREQEKKRRREDKAARDEIMVNALDKLMGDREDAKKKAVTDEKKPGFQAILDALKNSGEGQAAFLKKLGTELMETSSNQHKETQTAVKASAREQVGFNVAGYLDEFSKALSSEVRVLLNEVGNLRESRRALYMELAELLLMKNRQSQGDLIALYPMDPKFMEKTKKEEPPKEKPPAPPMPPLWPGWGPPMPMPMPPSVRPLPTPKQPPPGGEAAPPPPPPHPSLYNLPLPIV